jgi:hypothetical protein
VVRDIKVAKKPYRTPALRILDSAAAKSELEAVGAPQNADTRQMLSVLNQQLDGKKSAAHSASRSSLP